MTQNIVLIGLKILGSALVLLFICWLTSGKLLSLSELWLSHL